METKYVELYKLKDNGDQEIVVVCKLSEAGVVFEGDTIFIKNLTENGIPDYSDPSTKKKLFPKDGLKFLENLKYTFKSGYLMATDVLQ